ncbi:unnamed protein product [Diabrotica balteata]|uniref:Uncharacterized protein n=1 Tax=Diabrotica balteata TaxID=107213 RepID=A0A9N9SPZ7_DIABA|nr:unnamed protein product [Diabrotica balteata]
MRNFLLAISALSIASELLAAEHQDDLNESFGKGEVCVHYEKALLGLSWKESEDLGNAVSRNEDSIEEYNADKTEKNDEEVKNSTKLQENNKDDAKQLLANIIANFLRSSAISKTCSAFHFTVYSQMLLS